jgi:hypothetical protein
VRLNTTIALKESNIAKLHVPSYVSDFFSYEEEKEKKIHVLCGPHHDTTT